MKRLLLLALLAFTTIGLAGMIILSIINKETYGRFDTVIRHADQPVTYWTSLLLLVAMLGMAGFFLIKTWKGP